MRRLLAVHYLLVVGGALAGLVVGILFAPNALIAVFFLGIGVTAGAFLASIVADETLVGGGQRRPRSRWPQEDDERDQ